MYFLDPLTNCYLISLKMIFTMNVIYFVNFHKFKINSNDLYSNFHTFIELIYTMF